MPRVRRAVAKMQDRPNRWRLLLRRFRPTRPARRGATLLAGLIFAFFLLHGVGNAGLGGFGGMVANLGASLGLRVRSITVIGRDQTPRAEIDAALGVARGAPILDFSPTRARRRIARIAWVAHVEVHRQLPDTVVVRLVERHPIAIWQDHGQFSLIDHRGGVVGGTNVAAFAHALPLVVGPGAPAATAKLLATLAAYPALQARMLAAVRVGGRRWNLEMRNRTEILLPEGESAVAITRLVALDRAHGLLSRPLRSIDLRLPDRLALRLWPAGAGKPGQTTPPPATGHASGSHT